MPLRAVALGRLDGLGDAQRPGEVEGDAELEHEVRHRRQVLDLLHALGINKLVVEVAALDGLLEAVVLDPAVEGLDRRLHVVRRREDPHVAQRGDLGDDVVPIPRRGQAALEERRLHDPSFRSFRQAVPQVVDDLDAHARPLEGVDEVGALDVLLDGGHDLLLARQRLRAAEGRRRAAAVDDHVRSSRRDGRRLERRDGDGAAEPAFGAA